MIGRILRMFTATRPHMLLLSALLCAALALTGALTWQAHQSERERAEVAQNALIDMTSSAAGQWTRYVIITWGGSIDGAMPGVMNALLADPRAPFDQLLAAVTPERVCIICDHPRPVDSYFRIDLASGSVESEGGAPAPGVVAEVLRRVQAGQRAVFRRTVEASAYLVASEPTPDAIFVYIGTENRTPVTVFAVVLNDTTAQRMLENAYRGVRSDALAAAFGTTLDSLFVFQAAVGVAPVFRTGDEVAYARDVRVDTVPVFGLDLRVGVRPGAEQTLLLGNSADRRVLLLAALSTIVALLLIAALLQVRREVTLDRLRSDFVASVSHELRTPLAQIRMFTEMLLLGRARSDTDRRRALTIIDHEARRLMHLVENVLLFAKTDGGRDAGITREPVQLAPEVRLAAEVFAPLARIRNTELRLELQENIVVSVDRNALRQMLVNLLDNALKYGPAGQRVTVGAALFDDVARVWVDDQGPGIPAHERERVFDSFYRLSCDADTHIAGSGIGLALVRQLARLHEGDAVALPAPGAGARILIALPGARLASTVASNIAAAS